MHLETIEVKRSRRKKEEKRKKKKKKFCVLPSPVQMAVD